MSAFTLKLIALATMLIDHIGIAFFPDIIIFRIIGRISFPLYAYLIVEGFNHTSNLKKYIGRIIAFGIISEIPFNLLMSGGWYYRELQNVFFTFAIGLIMLYLIKLNTIVAMDYVILTMAIVVSVIFKTDYQIYGIVLIYIFYTFRDKKWIPVCLSSLLSLIYSGIQSFAVLGTVLILFYNGTKGHRLADNKYIKYMFYVVYPLHMLIFVVIREMLF